MDVTLPAEERVTGLDLKIERVRAQLQAKAVSEAMGISPSRLTRIESADHRVTPRMRARYLAALETCRTSRTSSAA